MIYPEGANPRHEHEWRVFEEVELPDDKVVILGVIDVKSNYIEHPQVVADRLVRLAKIVGKERVMPAPTAASTPSSASRRSIRDVAWLKLEALSEGAELASSQV